jgi:glycosyltransferase involved in cell wall biosynthesis
MGDIEDVAAPRVTTVAVRASAPAGVSSRPRVLFVGSMRYDLPLPRGLARKWDAVERRLGLRVIGRAGAVSGDDPRFRLLKASGGPLSRAVFYLSLPRVVGEEIRRFRPRVVITQSPFEAFACRSRLRGKDGPRVVVELHADWRTAADMYGSRWRRPYAGLADRAAVSALRRADAVRTVSAFTAVLAKRVTGEKPVASFPAFFDLASFTSEPLRPLPDEPAIAWIGALEGAKDPRLLVAAWRRVAHRMPDARLVVVGDGALRPVVDELARELPSQVSAIPRLKPADVARVLDGSTALAMSSRSEGLGRVIMEAFLRGRPVVAPAVGGIPELVVPGRNGLLVEPGDPGQLAEALLRVLGERDLAQRLADGAREDARPYEWSAEGYADSVREMVDRVLADPP